MFRRLVTTTLLLFAAVGASASLPDSVPAERDRGIVCETIKRYPKRANDQLSFRSGLVADLCRPFVKYQRHELDRCGDRAADPYSSRATQSKMTTSHYTWPSRVEMSRRGKANLYTDASVQNELPKLLARIEELRGQATNLCCGDDLACRTGMNAVQVSVCKPSDDPNKPDPCVFGGSFRMPGQGYDAVFSLVARQRGSGLASELRALARKNLTALGRLRAPASLVRGSITLSSYVSPEKGVSAIEPVLLHEFGHACSMVKMTNAAVSTKGLENQKRALKASKWLASAQRRCDSDFEIPEAQADLWESLGESRELASCLSDLATLNQKNQIDKTCSGLCPGHYLEESMGIAFSLLAGDLSGRPEAVFPNTCDHVRDGQHPLVSDVVECLSQHSPRFRERIKRTYACD